MFSKKSHSITIKGYLVRTAALLLAVVCVFVFAGDIWTVHAASKPVKSVKSAVKNETPVLISLDYRPVKNGKCTATLKWSAKKGYFYQILRKTADGKYKVIATKKAASKTGVFKDTNLKANAGYVYSVRQIKTKKSAKKKPGKYDKEGLALLNRPKVTVSFHNLNAVIKWNKVHGAKKYVIYRRVGRKGKWIKIHTVSKDVTKWTDEYDKTKTSDLKQYFLNSSKGVTPFIDPSYNPVDYMVRAVSVSKTASGKKVSKSLYSYDGVFHLESPAITSLDGSETEGTIRWGTVANADGYVILRKSDSGKWEELGRVPAGDGVYQSAEVSGDIAHDYFSVRAYARTSTGSYLYSGYDTGFTLRNRMYGDKNVLFIGDSLMVGSPNYGSRLKSFSIPNRVQQLTGVQYFNPSIPGATWHLGDNPRRRPLAATVAGMIAEGKTTDYAFGSIKVGENTSTFEDYDIVVLAAGTNDYRDCSSGFGLRDNDWTSEKVKKTRTKDLTFTLSAGTEHEQTYTRSYDYNIRTFDGAYNQVFKYIEEASLKRVLDGKPPIKVVSLGLFFSYKTYPFSKLHDRNVTPNSIGYTLKDYQKEINAMNHAWDRSPVLDVYYYDSQKTGIVSKKNCLSRTVDNTHFSRFTYGQYGNSIASFIISILEGDDGLADIDPAEISALMARYGIGESDPDDTDEPWIDDEYDDQEINPEAEDPERDIDTSVQTSGDGPYDTMTEEEAEQADEEAAEELARLLNEFGVEEESDY